MAKADYFWNDRCNAMANATAQKIRNRDKAYINQPMGLTNLSQDLKNSNKTTTSMEDGGVKNYIYVRDGIHIQNELETKFFEMDLIQ